MGFSDPTQNNDMFETMGRSEKGPVKVKKHEIENSSLQRWLLVSELTTYGAPVCLEKMNMVPSQRIALSQTHFRVRYQKLLEVMVLRSVPLKACSLERDASRSTTRTQVAYNRGSMTQNDELSRNIDTPSFTITTL